MLLLFAVLAPAGAGCQLSAPPEGARLGGVVTPADLDRQAAFSFAIMSDNKGDGPKADPRFDRMVRWIADAGDRFVIGLGDHLSRSRRNEFIPFIKADPWWRAHFLAAIQCTRCRSFRAASARSATPFSVPPRIAS